MVFEYMDHDLTGLMERCNYNFKVPQVCTMYYYIEIYCYAGGDHRMLLLLVVCCDVENGCKHVVLSQAVVRMV